MLITAGFIIGWLLPEVLAAARLRVPVGVNVLSAIAGALVAGYIVS